MIKKMITITAVLCAVLIAIGFIIKGTMDETFKLEQWSHKTDENTVSFTAGACTNKKTAIANAEFALLYLYGAEIKNAYTPYRAFFDETNNAWYVAGTVQKFHFPWDVRQVDDFAPHIILNAADGEVLAAWYMGSLSFLED